MPNGQRIIPVSIWRHKELCSKLPGWLCCSPAGTECTYTAAAGLCFLPITFSSCTLRYTVYPCTHNLGFSSLVGSLRIRSKCVAKVFNGWPSPAEEALTEELQTSGSDNVFTPLRKSLELPPCARHYVRLVYIIQNKEARFCSGEGQSVNKHVVLSSVRKGKDRHRLWLGLIQVGRETKKL